MCGRADADGGPCGHQVPVHMSEPVEATRPGSVTLPPSWPVRTRGGSTSSRSSPHLLGCSSATTPGSHGGRGRVSQDLGLTPFTEGYVTSALLIGAAIGAVLCGRINDALGRPPRHGERRTSLRPHLVTWSGSWCLSNLNAS